MHSLNPTTLITGNKNPSFRIIQLIKQYMKLFSPKSHFYDLLFLDLALCKYFVICLVCDVTFQKLRLYEYSGNLRYHDSDSDFLLCIFEVCCTSGKFGIY
jgi:hypothetical protein